MAETISKKEIEHLQVQPYSVMRDELQTGDLVFCSGSYFFSQAVQKFTKSVWSHVGMIYKDPTLERVFVLESETMIGVRLAPLSKYLRDYHGKNRPYKGNIVIARVDPPVDKQKLNQAISYGMDELTKPYDNFEIIRIGIRILFKISRRTRDRKYICSELVYDCFDSVGVPFNLRDEYVSPDDIWQDDQVQPQYRIY
ncbi:YiiX/YebB-like N1pC/P60 family cysteine hydrolase [Candidatus Thiodiazotropha sp. LNASS1]|uniref:YiiX/YebB-like N1pC/P60 family cysteine hydrolase n=1 Tax=Candidatus Thiodiazotropha sp. LNASS1 TaxID=3096260 RepID=UPI0034DFFAEB